MRNKKLVGTHLFEYFDQLKKMDEEERIDALKQNKFKPLHQLLKLHFECDVTMKIAKFEYDSDRLKLTTASSLNIYGLYNNISKQLSYLKKEPNKEIKTRVEKALRLMFHSVHEKDAKIVRSIIRQTFRNKIITKSIYNSVFLDEGDE